MATNGVMQVVASHRSTKALAEQMRPWLRADTEIIGIQAFSGSMAFYLRRPIIIVTPDAEELTSNYIILHYSAITHDPRSTIRPMAWLPAAFDRSRPRMLIVRDSDRRYRAMVEQHGGRLVGTGAHFVAYTMPP
jgi:hypothetical protein